MDKYAHLLAVTVLMIPGLADGQERQSDPSQSATSTKPSPSTPEGKATQHSGVEVSHSTLEFRGLPVAVSEDSQRFAYLEKERRINVVKLMTGQEIMSLDVEHLGCAAMSPDGTRLAGMRSERDVVVWKIPSGTQIARFDAQLENFPIHLEFIDNQRLAFTAYTKVIIWNLQDGSSHTIEIGKDQTHSVRVSPDGKTLVIGTGWFPLIWPHPSGGGPPKIPPGKAILWDIEARTRLNTLSGHRDFGIYSIAFTPAGRHFATGAGDVLLWDSQTLEKRVVYTCDEGKYAWSMDVSPDGQWLAIAVMWDGPVQLVNLHNGKQRTLRIEGAKFAEVRFLSGEENRLLTGGADGQIRLWSIR